MELFYVYGHIPTTPKNVLWSPALSIKSFSSLKKLSVPLLGLNANNDQSILIQFSISNARDGAWSFAEELSGKKGADFTSCIAARDTSIRNWRKGYYALQEN